MFATFKQIFNPKNKDLQKRILFTFGCLLIFKIGTAIIVPGIDKSALGTNSLGFLQLINVMGGGAMEKFSIFALGVMPYITASIIIQLLQMDIVPYLSELAKQGGTGRNKINQITRVVGIILAFVQGYMYSFAYVGNGTVLDYMQFATVLTAGTCLLLWMGDQITAKGVGNGISILIMAGIIASMPTMFGSAWTGLVTGSNPWGIILFILFVVVYLFIILGVVYEQTAERRIPIQYANKTNSSFGGKQNYIPFKLNSAGVVPVIFASALISIPAIIASVVKNVAFNAFVTKWLTMTSVTGFILYIVLIIGFSYFYTFLQLKPKEMAENLQKNGGFIPGVRPGDETVSYINKILYRITFVGAFALALIAALPIVFGALVPNLPSSVTLGGTGLLIVVGVIIEIYKQLESQVMMKSYRKGRN